MFISAGHMLQSNINVTFEYSTKQIEKLTTKWGDFINKNIDELHMNVLLFCHVLDLCVLFSKW